MSAREFTVDELETGARCAASRAARTTSRELGDAVAGRYGFTLSEVLLPDRHQPLPAVRAEFYAALRARGWSYPAIGRFCHRHHTTVLAALRRHAPRGEP